MDYLQYFIVLEEFGDSPWVLNLVINGLPSILRQLSPEELKGAPSFKPCYKWITFNT